MRIGGYFEIRIAGYFYENKQMANSKARKHFNPIAPATSTSGRTVYTPEKVKLISSSFADSQQSKLGLVY